MATDFYSVLGVPKDADAGAIKKAYRKLARDLHPDKNAGNKASETRFKEVNRAYAQWQQRAANGGAGGYRGGGGGFGGAVNLEDLFSGAVPGGSAGGGEGDPFADLFGRASRRRGPVRGRDIEQELTIDFVSAVKGTSLQLRNPSSPEPVTVRIPPGADEGSRVRIKGQGAASPNGGPAGDLILVIHVEPHPLFEREGDDLTIEVPIWTSEAIQGAKVKVPTFDGDVTVKVPAGTQSGTKLRVRGKGVVRKGREPGDLYVRFMVHVPKGDDPKLLELAEELAKFERGDVRANLHI